MDFVSNQEPQIKAMLHEMGLKGIEELFDAIPSSLKLAPPQHDDGLSEFEGLQWMESLAGKNAFARYDNYLGAGAYEHHIPAIVDAICSRSEFLTAYTPYQAEASQGMLQAIYEYQRAICALTGMDVSNASLYDGASACAEALLMALRLQKNRQQVLVAHGLNPHYRAVVEQYLGCHAQIHTLAYDKNWQVDLEALEEALNENTAAVLIQSPNFFGILENVKQIAARAKAKGALLIMAANPLSYGIYATAGELGADIAVGDCQPFGLPLEFGGPYAGYLACRKPFVRQMPGRFVGETKDTNGKTGYVLTLQAREQHIRREKATSNICTNQALTALASLVAIMWYGKNGVKDLAEANFKRSSYLKEHLGLIQGGDWLSPMPHFNEFAFSFGLPYDQVQRHFRDHHIEPGVHLGRYDPMLMDYFLIAATETKSKRQLDRYLQVASTLRRTE